MNMLYLQMSSWYSINNLCAVVKHTAKLHLVWMEQLLVCLFVNNTDSPAIFYRIPWRVTISRWNHKKEDEIIKSNKLKNKMAVDTPFQTLNDKQVMVNKRWTNVLKLWNSKSCVVQKEDLFWHPLAAWLSRSLDAKEDTPCISLKPNKFQKFQQQICVYFVFICVQNIQALSNEEPALRMCLQAFMERKISGEP